MEREVFAQHRRLRGLFADVQDALDAGLGVDEVREALMRLGEALDVHFEQEDRLYFPPIVSLRPEHRGRIDALGEEHGLFRERLARIAEGLEVGGLEATNRAFQEFAADFGRHEKSEEDLLTALDRDVASAR